MTVSTEAINPTEGHVRQIPKWLAAVIVLLAIGGGTWFIWRQFSGPKEGVVFQVGTIVDPWGGRGPRPPPAPRPNVALPGIHSIGANIYRVQGGDFFMLLSPTITTYTPLRMNYARNLVNQDERALVQLAVDAANPVFMKNLQLTDDQNKQLADVRKQVGGMVMPDADRDKLGKLWKAWNDAKGAPAKDAAEKDMLAAVVDVGNRNLNASRTLYQGLAAQVKKIVTAQQVVKYRQLRG